MKKYGILILLGLVLLISGCREKGLSYTWSDMEIYIINYTEEDVVATIQDSKGVAVEKIVEPSGISMDRADFKKEVRDDGSQYLYFQDFIKTSFTHFLPSIFFDNIGGEKASQIGDVYSINSRLRSIEVTQHDNILYRSNIILENSYNTLYWVAPSGPFLNVYGVIPFEQRAVDEVYIFWEYREDTSDNLLKCYIGIFPAE